MSSTETERLDERPEAMHKLRTIASNASRPLSQRASIGVAAVTAFATIGIGIGVAEWLPPPRSMEIPAPSQRELSPPPIRGVESARPLVSASSGGRKPVPGAVPLSASARASMEKGVDDPRALASSLPKGYGDLIVEGPTMARVYLGGMENGPVGRSIRVACGAHFLRLGLPADGGRYPSWVGPGRSIVVACQTTTRIAAEH